MSDPVPEGHVRLVLFSRDDSSFCLQIPLDIIDSLCLKPRKYLVFLGWCILGVEGQLALVNGGGGIPTNGSLEDQGIYYYVANVGDLSTAVDLEVIKQRTNVPSETAGTRDDFRARLLDRDIGCVWTGLEPEYGGEGTHIIPFKRGSE